MSGQRLRGTSAQIIFRGGVGGGGGMSRNFSGMGGWKNIQTCFDYIWVWAGRLWPLPRGNLCSFFFHVYLVF